MPERLKVRVAGSQPKKNSLLSGKRLSPSMYWTQVNHSRRLRYIAGVMNSDG